MNNIRKIKSSSNCRRYLYHFKKFCGMTKFLFIFYSSLFKIFSYLNFIFLLNVIDNGRWSLSLKRFLFCCHVLLVMEFFFLNVRWSVLSPFVIFKKIINCNMKLSHGIYLFIGCRGMERNSGLVMILRKKFGILECGITW